MGSFEDRERTALGPAQRVQALLSFSKASRSINLLAVALSVAACTGSVCTFLIGSDGTPTTAPLSVPLIAAVTTLVSVFGWGVLARIRPWPRLVRWGLSVPFAALNAGVAGALLKWNDSGPEPASAHFPSGPLAGFVIALSLGSVVWLPALLLTLTLFGPPLYSVERAASKGLSSEDRSERDLSVVAAVIATLSFVYCIVSWRETEAMAIVVLSLSAMLLGAFGAIRAHLRACRRDTWLADVRAGKCEGLAIEATEGRELLVRVAQYGPIYRGARVAEALLEVQPSGDVKQPAARASRRS